MTEIFRGSETMSDVFPFRGEFARVEVNPNDLRRDFVDAAAEQGIDISWAWEFSLSINFAFQNFSELPEQYRDKIIPLWAKVVRKLNDTPRAPLLGMIFPNEKGNEAGCFIDIGAIVKHTSRGGIYPGFKMPREISEEARRAAVSQALNMVWLHERQHLIQTCQPDFVGKRAKGAARSARAWAMALAGIMGYGLVIASSHVPENLWLATGTVGTSSALASAVTLTGLVIHEFVWSSKEKEARREAEMAIGASPFKVSFES